jgi:hypothetical protein
MHCTNAPNPIFALSCGCFTLTRWIGNILRLPDTDGQADVPSQEFPIDENRLFHVKMVRLVVEVITP